MFGGFLRLPELIILAVLVLLLIGGKNIPNLAKGLGQGISEFRKQAKPDEEAKHE